MARRLFTSHQREGPVARSDCVVDCLVDVAPRSTGKEVVSKLREPRLRVCAVDRLKRLAHLLVKAYALARRQLVIERLLDKGVRERVAARDAWNRNDDACRFRFLERCEQLTS